MSDHDSPGSKPPDPPGGTAGKRSTVGVYDRPAKADRPPMLPKIITAIIVILALILTFLFWPGGGD